MTRTPLKILIDARMVAPQIHGIARYTVDLVRELSRLGNQVSILTHSGDEKKIIGTEFVHGEIKVHAGFLNPLEPAALSAIRSYANYDVVHFPSFALPLLTPKNAVITLHDLIHLNGPAKLMHKIYFHSLVKNALKNCRRVITVSEWSRQEVHEKLGTPLQKISVVRNGIDGFWFTPSETLLPEVGTDKPYFLCVSNLKPHKNVVTLIGACQKLWRKGLDFKLVLLLGGGKIPKEWRISGDDVKHLLLFNRLPEDELKRLFKGARALVSPSIFEGYNYPAAEALAQGVPVILSQGSAHDELGGEGVTFYGPPEDGQRLSDALMESLHKDGRTTRRPPTLREMAEKTLEAYGVSYI